MKRFLLSFLTVFVSTFAFADDIIVLDSMYVEEEDGTVQSKQYAFYNDKGKIIKETEYSMATGYLGCSKYTYDASGLMTRNDDFDRNDVLTGYVEFSDYNHGLPFLIVGYDLDDNGTMQPSMKEKIVKYENNTAEVELYEYENGEWVLDTKSYVTYNSKGLPLSQEMHMEIDGMTVNWVETMEYDSHDQLVKTTTNVKMGAMTLASQIDTYEYTYGAYDMPSKCIYRTDGDIYSKRFISMEEYFYGKLKPAGISNIYSAPGKTTVYGVNGVYHGSSMDNLPAGTYIVKNNRGIRKMIKK